MATNIPLIGKPQPKMVVAALSEIVDWGQTSSNIGKYQQNAKTLGEGIKVAVLDTGVDTEHSDLRANLKEAVDFTGCGARDTVVGHGCINPDALVYTSLCGLQPISRVFDDAPGIVHNMEDGVIIKDVSRYDLNTVSLNAGTNTSEVKQILAVHRLPHRGEVVRVKTQEGDLVFTPWHPVYVASSDGKRVERRRADELQVGDAIACSKETEEDVGQLVRVPLKTEWICTKCGYVARGGTRRQCRGCNKGHWHEGPTITSIDLNEDLAFWLGLVLSDGHVHSDGLSIEFTNNNDILIDMFSSLCRSLFDKTTKEYEDPRQTHCRRVRLHSVDANRLVADVFGLGRGRKSRTVTLPELIAKSPKNVIFSFVAGVIEGDGNIGEGGRIRVCSGSEKFAHSLCFLMRTLGLRSSVHEFKCLPFSTNGGEKTSINYHIKIACHPEIVSRLASKRDAVVRTGGIKRRTFAKITEVENSEYDGYMYDFTVADNHNYVANGLIVSNTHVAGIVAAAADDHGVVGVAPKCELYSGRVLDNDGTCPGDYEWIINGINWAISRDVDIINLSLGSPDEPPAAIHAAIQAAVMSGILVVVAAGNDGLGSLNWPARYPECLAVAAIGPDGRLARFSNYGDGLGVAAPGVDIYSTWINGQYAKESGTCLPGYTQLLSSCGPVSMFDVKEGDELISCDPKTLQLQRNAVAKKWSRGVKQLYRVKTANWTLDGTGNHPVLTVGITKGGGKKGKGDRKSYSFVWKRIDELEEGDLVFHIHDIDLPPADSPDVVESPDFARLLGFMIGDGWLSSPKNGMYMIAFARGEHEHINREYEDLLAEASENPVHTTKDGRQCYTFDKRLFYLLSHFGVDDGARNKRVPPAIFAASREVRWAFLIGYLDADGTTPKKTALKNLTFSSASLALVEDVKKLLATVGVQTGNICSRHRENQIAGRTISGHEHSTTICRSEACRLFDVEFTGRGGIERVGHEMIGDKKFRQMILESGLRVSKVKSVEAIHSEMVYDIEMSDQSAPCFIANGIVVHNSMACPFIAGTLALMLAYHRNGEEHSTPLVTKEDAIAHLRRFERGKCVTSIGQELGIGILDFGSDAVEAASCSCSCSKTIVDPMAGVRVVSDWSLWDQFIYGVKHFFAEFAHKEFH